MNNKLSKADIERVKEKIRGLEAQLREQIRTNVGGKNDRYIKELETQIENLNYYLNSD